jgi:hypothetical protein
VSITADLAGLDSTDQVAAYLTDQIGPGTTVANQLAFNPSVEVGSPGTYSIFSGLNLNAGTYYLVLSTTSTSENAAWANAFPSPSDVATGPGVTSNGFADVCSLGGSFPCSTYAPAGHVSIITW